MRYLRGFFLLLLVDAVFVNPATGQAQTPRSVIEPEEVFLPVGQSQSFQLLQADGNEGRAGDWLVSDPDVADLKSDGDHVTVTAKTVGRVVLTNTSGAHDATIVIHDGIPPMPAESRWALQPIDGGFTHALWASWTWGGSAPGGDSVSEKTPSYFYEDRGPGGSHIRAVREDGLQVWQWPESFSLEKPQMICGDSLGGVLVQIGEKESRTLVDLDSTGHERWRYSAPGFTGKDFTYTLTGALFFLEEHPNMAGARIVGLDAKEGIRKFAFELPVSQQTVHGLVIRDGKLVCSPDAESSMPLPSRHSKMLTNAEETANLAYSEFSLVAEGPPCVPGSVLVPGQVRVKAKQSLGDSRYS
jgi:hypothetical protein